MNHYISEAVPQRFIANLLEYLCIDITEVAKIEIDYRAVRIHRYIHDETGRKFVGFGGEVGTASTDYPLQTWEDYEKETNATEDVRS